jgi:hypothetical protein
MKASQLIRVLMEIPADAEIRIGDQVESGPYLNAAVGGVFKGTDGSVILCADDDDQWREEPTGIDHNLPVLWTPQS